MQRITCYHVLRMKSAQDQTALLKLAQVYRCVNSYDSCDTVIERICRKKGDNNYQLPSDVAKELCLEDLVGSTVLHCVALYGKESKALDILLNNGADFTIKNQAGLTALHNLIKKVSSNCNQESKLLYLKNIRELLAAHIKYNNFSNPCDNDGISHFHIACMINNVTVIEFFLNNGISIDHTVNVDSNNFAGYTPLHFTVKIGNLEATDVLLKHGANIFAKDAKGMTPFHILMEDKLHVYKLIDASFREPDYNVLWDKIYENEMIMDLLLENSTVSDSDFLAKLGMTRFHIASSMQDSSRVESLLQTWQNIIEIHRPVKSVVCSGYRALHFAAHCNIDTVKILMTSGGNIDTQDDDGVTPFDICVSRQNILDLRKIVLQKPTYKHIKFLHSKTKLVDLLSAMWYSSKLKLFLNGKEINVSISSNSPLWPGYTPLHLAVVFSKSSKFVVLVNRKPYYQLIDECLSRGADVTIQDAHGSTPVHLAFKLNKDKILERLLESHYIAENPVNEDGLSHLHIACAVDNENVVKQLVNQKNVNVPYNGKVSFQNVKPTFTPLHIAVASGHLKIISILLKQGADVNKLDAKGQTPIHLAFIQEDQIASELLSSQSLKECVVPGVNLSHLHVACQFNNIDAVKKLIKLGADVNLAILYGEICLSDTVDWTPLHFAAGSGAFEIAKLLIEQGADILAKSSCHVDGKCSSPLSIALEYQEVEREDYEEDEFREVCSELVDVFMKTLENDGSLRKRMENEFGITMLHLACYIVDVDAVEKLLIEEVNVNAQVNKDSKLWPGCTPLHVLVIQTNAWPHDEELGKDVDEIIKLLLSEGAVALANADGETPIHLSFKSYKVDSKEDTGTYINYHRQIEIPERSRVKMLMESHTNFNVNPVNREGISHFHIAVATDDLDTAMQFLEHEVDVNQATNYFNKCAAGYTPLHYAIDLLSHKPFKGPPEYSMVELLLEYEADPNKEDVCGNTPFHLATRALAPRDDLLKMLIEYRADIKKKNLCSETVLDLL